MIRFLFGILSVLLLYACSAELKSNVVKQPRPSGGLNSTTSNHAMQQEVSKNTDIVLEAPEKPRGPGGIVDDNSGAGQSAPICEGVMVEPRVLDFLSCEIVQILSQPDRVESFILEPQEEPELDEKYRLGLYPIKANGQGLNLEGDNLTLFQKLVFAESSYIFGMEKRCRFFPDVGLHFVKGDKAVEILFSKSCKLWRFIYGEEDKLEDFDPVQNQLTFLNSLFPQPEPPVENSPRKLPQAGS
jgi:hypothetical protein